MSKLNVSYSILFEEEDSVYMDENELADMIAEFIVEQLEDMNLCPSEVVVTRVELEE